MLVIPVNGCNSALSNESFTDADRNPYEADGASRSSTIIQSPDTRHSEQPAPDSKQRSSPFKKMPQRRKQILLTALGVGAIVAGILGLRWWQYASTHEQTDDVFVGGIFIQLAVK